MTRAMIDLVEQLFTQQTEAWPLLRKGINGLLEAKTRSIAVDGQEVLLRHIPHRVASTTAAMDPEAIRKRPCFLCPQNLYPEQKGVAFGPDFTMYCNPFPIVEKHLTIVHREHRPQRIEGQLGTMFDLAAELPGFFVIYNGPECGASAPDHMHLQAGSREGLPVVRDVSTASGLEFSSHGARVLFFRGDDRKQLLQRAEHALEVMSSVTGKVPEPWCNIALFHEAGSGWTLLFYPRTKHRPNAFYTGELTVSPATIDMSGILVTPVASHFDRVSPDDVAGVFREVTLDEGQFSEIVARVRKLS